MVDYPTPVKAITHVSVVWAREKSLMKFTVLIFNLSWFNYVPQGQVVHSLQLAAFWFAGANLFALHKRCSNKFEPTARRLCVRTARQPGP